MLLTLNIQFARLSSGGDCNMAPFEHILIHLYACGSDKPCPAMKRHDPRLGKTLFSVLRNWISEGALEAHQVRPIQTQAVLADAFSVHTPCPINYLCCTDEHFLGVAATKSTGPAKRKKINDRDPPSGFATGSRDGRGRSAGTDHQAIKMPENASVFQHLLCRILLGVREHHDSKSVVPERDHTDWDIGERRQRFEPQNDLPSLRVSQPA